MGMVESGEHSILGVWDIHAPNAPLSLPPVCVPRWRHHGHTNLDVDSPGDGHVGTFVSVISTWSRGMTRKTVLPDDGGRVWT